MEDNCLAIIDVHTGKPVGEPVNETINIYQIEGAEMIETNTSIIDPGGRGIYTDTKYQLKRNGQIIGKLIGHYGSGDWEHKDVPTELWNSYLESDRKDCLERCKNYLANHP